jgi:hypothetical protein
MIRHGNRAIAGMHNVPRVDPERAMNRGVEIRHRHRTIHYLRPQFVVAPTTRPVRKPPPASTMLNASD